VKEFQNRLTVDKVIVKSLTPLFYETVYMHFVMFLLYSILIFNFNSYFHFYSYFPAQI